MVVKNKKGAVVHSHSALAVYMRIIAAVSAVVKRIFHWREEKSIGMVDMIKLKELESKLA